MKSKSLSKSKRKIKVIKSSSEEHYREGQDMECVYDSIPVEFKEVQIHYDEEQFTHLKLPMRAMIVGPSSAGKTQTLCLLMKYMHHPFSKIYLYIKDPEEQLYKCFISKIHELEKENHTKILTVETDLSKTVKYDDLDKRENNLIVIDDMMCGSPKDLQKVNQLFIMGRKKNASVIFLIQLFFIKALMTARQNLSTLILKGNITPLNLRNILRAYCDDEEEVQKYYKLYRKITKEKVNNFMTIRIGDTTKYHITKNLG